MAQTEPACFNHNNASDCTTNGHVAAENSVKASAVSCDSSSGAGLAASPAEEDTDRASQLQYTTTAEKELQREVSSAAPDASTHDEPCSTTSCSCASGSGEPVNIADHSTSAEPDKLTMTDAGAVHVDIGSSSDLMMEPQVASSLIAEFGDSLSQFGNSCMPAAADHPGSHSTPQGSWARTLVLECARAISDVNKVQMVRVQHIMWILSELASPYGDCEQRLAFYFLQALFCKLSGNGPSYHAVLCSAMEKMSCFVSLRRTILKFQECSPWTTFGHVAANGAILEAFEGESRVHILDLSNTFCTQWPTLLEALATRADGAPYLRLTTAIVTQDRSAMTAMKEVGVRMEKFARLMGVPFEFRLYHELDMEKLLTDQEHYLAALVCLQPGEVLAINCNQCLHHVPLITQAGVSPRDVMVQNLRKMNPKILTVVEEEADMVSGDFESTLSETMQFYSTFFQSLEASFPKVSNERLMLEREAARGMLKLLTCTNMPALSWITTPLNASSNTKVSSCDGNDGDSERCCRIDDERRETSGQWGERLARAGFAMASFSDDVLDDVRALLKRYPSGQGWTLVNHNTCLALAWRDQACLFAFACKPAAAHTM